MPPLKKAPQSPTDLDTKFFLYTRIFQETEIRYDDGGKSLAGSGLDPRLPTRIVVHGFKGSLKDEGAVSLVDNLLKIEDSNVIVVDWEKGAQGPSYIVSAANTQLIGRQLALLIMDAINMGVPPEMIHVIGFSLGAHIAGYAGRAVRQAMDVQLGRITGLDPASPLFREFLKASLISLNVEDARIVDVIHTDGAPRWPSGFGLWKVIGDVDFFPNGGRDQPGCTHVPASLIVSHFEGVVNSSIVCNHARGFQLFLESTIPLKVERSVGGVGAPCRFRSFPCHSRDHFGSGACFPYTCNLNATGIFYLFTIVYFRVGGFVTIKISRRVEGVRQPLLRPFPPPNVHHQHVETYGPLGNVTSYLNRKQIDRHRVENFPWTCRTVGILRSA
ncbi:hypothetical protein AAG570_005211 [Ranatra chinensis]|uniref:Lipase domain-containing protein n=1 Tax=Ranatra chinensis TaxID=642074 RepID=A0ABD0XZT3_9HEMI